MNRLFKGAIAGAAGVALLLGGAGTFALWQDTVNFGTADAITAGTLRFDRDHMPNAAWALNTQPVAEEDIDELRLVPGDVLTMTFDDVPLIAEGTHLVAKFGVDLGGLTANTPAAAAFLNDLDYTVHVDGTKLADKDTVDVKDGGDVYDVVVTITFDQAAIDAAAHGGVVGLKGLQLTVTQVPHALHPQLPATDEPAEPDET